MNSGEWEQQIVWNDQELGMMNAVSDEQWGMGMMISREQPTV